MTYDNAEDYLVRAQEAADFHDETEGRKEGIRQFIDEKSYKPGFSAYDRTRSLPDAPAPAEGKAKDKAKDKAKAE
jgi:trans-feruloyl-CoA hydratase/vanillin synthase